MSGHSDPKIQEIIALHNEGDYLQIIEIFERVSKLSSKSEKTDLHLVTWPLPSLEHLKEFGRFLAKEKVRKIFSIGCGSGLLEWLMLEVTRREINYPVDFVGVEIDSRWWKSTYSPPTFVPLCFVGEDFIHTKPFGDSCDLAIFCYFNNLPIFQEYLESFQGNLVVLIGPISNEQFCAPGPRELAENEKLPIDQWQLISIAQFGFVEIDHVAVYERTRKTTHSICDHSQ